MLEHDYEPEPGIPEALPDDEQVLWQGRSSFASLVKSTFHVRKLAIYFALLIGLHITLGVQAGEALSTKIASAAGLAILAAITLGMLTLYARLVARATMFTITNKRVVMRAGVAVPVTLNLPYSRIDGASLREHADGSGDIAILPEAASRVSYILMWPMVKPWRWLRVQPVLRGIDDAQTVAQLLAEQLKVAAVDAREQALRVDAPPPAPAETPKGKRRFRPYPTIPMAAAASLVVMTLVAVAWIQLTDSGSRDNPSAVIASIELRFEDHEDGSVIVIDASDGMTLDVLAPGTNGFLRSAMRTFVRARRAEDIGEEAPFTLQRTETGQLLLSDPVTAQRIDLRAFGPTNAEAFGRFLTIREQVQQPDELKVTETEAPPDATAVALSSPEGRP